MINYTNSVWKSKLKEVKNDYDFIVKPRGMEVRERLHGTYTVRMPAYIDLASRKVNLSFMFAEAAWIISGSNRLSDVSEYMKAYKNFSDDGVFLKGAYGPKVIEQLPYVVDSLVNDKDSRQAVMGIWRERPGPSKDIPCTTNMQFLIRNNKLYMIVTMRSNDVVLGFTYDVFTFSMVAKSVQLLLREQGIDIGLGDLTVNAGSLHLYETHYGQVDNYIEDGLIDLDISTWVERLDHVETYEGLISSLKMLADLSSRGTSRANKSL